MLLEHMRGCCQNIKIEFYHYLMAPNLKRLAAPKRQIIGENAFSKIQTTEPYEKHYFNSPLCLHLSIFWQIFLQTPMLPYSKLSS